MTKVSYQTLYNVVEKFMRTVHHVQIGRDEYELIVAIYEHMAKQHPGAGEKDLSKLIVDEAIKEITEYMGRQRDSALPIIPADQVEEFTGLTRTQYVTIDSRDRDMALYPNPNNYEVELDSPIQHVMSISLESAEIPASQYNVNSANNILHFQENAGDVLEAVITPGIYATITELGTAIETALGAASSTGANFTVSSSTTTQTVTIASDIGGTASFFSLFFTGSGGCMYRTGSIGPVIGFSQMADLSGSASYTGTRRYTLRGEPYVIMKVGDIDLLGGTSRNISTAFAKLNLNAEADGYKYFTARRDYEIVKLYSPARLRIDRVPVQFYTYCQDLYDFNGLEHSFVLKIVSAGYKPAV
jgi:hypothetical protein